MANRLETRAVAGPVRSVTTGEPPVTLLLPRTNCRRSATKNWRSDHAGRGRRDSLARAGLRALRVRRTVCALRVPPRQRERERRPDRYLRAGSSRSLRPARCVADRTTTTASHEQLNVPEGHLLTSTSRPFGHRFSGDQASALSRASGPEKTASVPGGCFTGIRRADSAIETQFGPAQSEDIFRLRPAGLRDGNPPTLRQRCDCRIASKVPAS